MITLFGQYLGYMLAGSAVAEKVFSLNGVGTYLISCVVSGDSPATILHCDNCGSVCDCKSCSGCDKQVVMPTWMVREIND